MSQADSPIIEFIWNRVGFTNPKAFFEYSEGKRKPKYIFDPATGSGGFLVEAARRIRDEAGIDVNDFQDLLDIRTAILTGIFGSEISTFPYYITEVNLLIQLTPVIKKMMDLNRAYRGRGTPALGIVPIDALALYTPPSLLPEEEYKFDHIRDLLPLSEEQKKTIFRKIKREFDGKFSYCCANPPYIGEKGNKNLFKGTLLRFPYWEEFYQGKMDYLYFFVILGLSKLRNSSGSSSGGKLGFITTAYWPTADSASKLRKYILQNAKIKEIIFFEDVKIFEYAKGQHNMIFILEKCSEKEKENERNDNRIKIIRVLCMHQELSGRSIRDKLRVLTQHIEQNVDKDRYQSEYIQVFWSALKQGELSKEGRPWAFVEKKEIIDLRTGNNIMPFEVLCKAVFQGVDPKANSVTNTNIKFLPSNKVEAQGIKEGDGIFVLKKNEIVDSWPNHIKKLLKPLYKNSDIAPYIVDIEQVEEYLLYVCDDSHLYPEVFSHLSKFEEILLNRPENSSLFIARPRNPELIENEKIVVSRWGGKTRSFAYQGKDFYELSDVNVFVLKTDITENVFYILGLLNSSLIQKWIHHAIAKQGAIQLSLLKNIPIRRINFDNLQELQIHDGIRDTVIRIRSYMTELISYSKYFRGIKLTRLKLQDPLPAVSPTLIVQALPPEQRFSIRTHQNIQITYPENLTETNFILNRVEKVDLTLEGPELKLFSKDKKIIVLKSHEELLQIIYSILQDHKNESWQSIKELPLIPENARDYEKKKAGIIEKVTTLRKNIQRLQVSIDEAVFNLYEVSYEQIKDDKRIP